MGLMRLHLQTQLQGALEVVAGSETQIETLGGWNEQFEEAEGAASYHHLQISDEEGEGVEQQSGRR